MSAESSSDSNVPHYQVQFFTTDSRYQNLPTDVINIPASADHKQLNLLIKAAQYDEEAKPVNFDFLVNGLLLRTSLLEHIETNQVSAESVIRVECIQLEPPPIPKQDLPDAEWIADLKVLPNCIFCVNYGGELILWTGTENLSKTAAKKLDNDPLKCLDVFDLDEERHIIVGGQDQVLTLLKVTKASHKKHDKLDLETLAVFRGHKRSVECVAVNQDGTRALSGSFDRCLKVWRTDQSNDGTDEDTYTPSENETRNKKAKSLIVIRTPMVTLESHREAVVGVKWDPLNAGHAVTVSWDHKIMEWDLEMPGPIQTLNSNKAFTSLSLNRFSGLVLTGSTDPIVRLWDLRSKVKNAFLGHLGWVSEVCWAPNVEHLFVTAGFDNTVKMWDIRSSKSALYDLMGHQNRVLTVDWGPNGLIASGSADCTIKTFAR